MANAIFDGLDIKETEYKLSNGNKLKIVALDIFQSLEIQKRIMELSTGDKNAKSTLFKEVAQLSVVNEDYEPYLTKADLNKLSRASDGQILLEIFNEVMKISGVGTQEEEDAKKNKRS